MIGKDWRALLTENVSEARPLLSVVLAGDRIAFAPMSDRQYEVTVPIALDRVVSAVISELGVLPDVGTSPAARVGNWNQQFIEIAGRTAA